MISIHRRNNVDEKSNRARWHLITRSVAIAPFYALRRDSTFFFPPDEILYMNKNSRFHTLGDDSDKELPDVCTRF